MTLYDGVVGIDEPALNQFVQSVYQALHDVALKGTVTLPKPQLGVSAIGYDVASVPQISLSPSALVQQHYRAMLAAMNVPAESLDSARGGPVAGILRAHHRDPGRGRRPR